MNILSPPPKRVLGRVFIPTVTLAHGGGGKAMKDLIDDVFISAFAGAAPDVLEDQARFDLAMLAAYGDRLAFTTERARASICLTVLLLFTVFSAV